MAARGNCTRLRPAVNYERCRASRDESVLASLFRRHDRRAVVLAAYGGIVEHARQPGFFVDGGVPDTLDGRFELLALHVFLVLRRLKREGDDAALFAQTLFDTMFADLDRGLREMGAGDLGVGRRVKAMATGFYGRIAAYEKGLSEDGSDGGGAETALAAALRRNLYGTVAPSDEQIAAMAAYARRQAATLAAQPLAAMLAGEIAFASLSPP
jgi:cytochrome b pre-mRNA-processing protein 3